MSPDLHDTASQILTMSFPEFKDFAASLEGHETIMEMAREITNRTAQAHAPGPLRLERRPQSAFDGGAARGSPAHPSKEQS